MPPIFHSYFNRVRPTFPLQRGHQSAMRVFGVLLIVFLWYALLSPASTYAQNVQSPQNTVDQAFRGDFKVDPLTLALTMHITLRQYSERGGATIPVTFYYSSKVWRMEYGGYHQGGACCEPSFTANIQGLPDDNSGYSTRPGPGRHQVWVR